MLFFLVVRGAGSEGVVDADGIVHVLVHGVLLVALVVFVKIEDHVAKAAIKHLPASLTQRS